ncbi:serine/threonine protein kinase KIN, putative [Plasmodium gallinaceum]|uniref:Serine/threonine protein kinase KIN, putative n=1 Tax=Plasmodium gallinaceum TaxID=5849 RepID=A0A1J1GR18_PLAGA|nr:serine/threonine protein kinase KIN, putative [Plasmodium gallinaceum]CRG94738.1 serine/threonine protein kinase KIN, putative [Plasmodium gallinaceum]
MNSIKKIGNNLNDLNKQLNVSKEEKNNINSLLYINKIKKKNICNFKSLNRNKICELKIDENSKKMLFSSNEKTYENKFKNNGNFINRKSKCKLISKINEEIYDRRYGCKNKELNMLKCQKDKNLLTNFENVNISCTKKKENENKCKLIHKNKENNQNCSEHISDKSTKCNFIKTINSSTKNITNINSILKEKYKKKKSFKNKEWNSLSISLKTQDIKIDNTLHINKSKYKFEKLKKRSFDFLKNTSSKNRTIQEPINEIEKSKQNINNKNKLLNKFETKLKHVLQCDNISKGKEYKDIYQCKNECKTPENYVENIYANKERYIKNIIGYNTNLKNGEEGNLLIKKSAFSNSKTETKCLEENEETISQINEHKVSINFFKKNLEETEIIEKLIYINLKKKNQLIQKREKDKDEGDDDQKEEIEEIEVKTKEKNEEKSKGIIHKKKEKKTQKKDKWKILKNELKGKIKKKYIKEYLNILKNNKTYKIIVVKNNNKEVGNYIITNKIGKGTFGEVCLGIHMYTYEIVAVKILNKKKLLQMISYDKIMKEIEIHKSIDHNHICRFYEVHENIKNLYMILEYLPNGDLLTYIYKNNYINENKARRILYQLISAVEYLHKINIVHRDLKPENILLDYNNNVKLIDFGLSTIFNQNNLLTTSCGSPFYTSPEILLGNKYKAESTDVWSLGIILFLLLNNKLPFNHNDLNKLFQKIIKGILHFEPYVSLNAKNLIQNMLNVNFKKRYSLNDIKNHIWFTNHNLKINLNNLDNGCNLIDCDTCLYKIIFQNNDYYNDFIINKICKITNLDKNNIYNQLKNEKKNFIKTAFHLLLNKSIRILSKKNYLFSNFILIKKDNIPLISNIKDDNNNEVTSSCNNSLNNSLLKIINKQKDMHYLNIFNISKDNKNITEQKSLEGTCSRKSNTNNFNITNKIHDSTNTNNDNYVNNCKRNIINNKKKHIKINILDKNKGDKSNLKENKCHILSNKNNNSKTNFKKYIRTIHTNDDKVNNNYNYLKNKSSIKKKGNNSNSLKDKNNYITGNYVDIKSVYKGNSNKIKIKETRLNLLDKVLYQNNYKFRRHSMLTYNEIKKISLESHEIKNENNLLSIDTFNKYYDNCKLKTK